MLVLSRSPGSSFSFNKSPSKSPKQTFFQSRLSSFLTYKDRSLTDISPIDPKSSQDEEQGIGGVA